MGQNKFSEVINLVLEFALNNDQVLAIGLCGSWARGTPGPESDIDLSIITADKESFKITPWLEKIDFKKIDERIIRFEDKTYGQVWSRHVFLKGGTEIEFSFADRSWAEFDPVDSGTKKVVLDGYKILYDPHGILNSLMEHVNSNP